MSVMRQVVIRYGWGGREQLLNTIASHARAYDFVIKIVVQCSEPFVEVMLRHADIKMFGIAHEDGRELRLTIKSVGRSSPSPKALAALVEALRRVVKEIPGAQVELQEL